MNKVNFTQFKQKYPQYNHISDDWLAWFVGFFEADGSLTIGKNLAIVITQYELNKDLLDEIQQTLHIGRVIVQTKHIVPGRLWTYRFIVNDFRGQLIILDLLKNNLVFPYRLKRYNDFTNIFKEKLSRSKRFENLKCDLKLVTQTAYPNKDDAWLSGFMDGDGCFYTSFTSKHKLVASISFFNKNACSQDLFEHIKDNIFNKEGNIRITKKGITYDTRSLKKGLPLVCNYFDKFNLKTTKIYDYLILLRVLEKYKNIKNLDSEELNQLVILIKRTQHRQKKRDWKNVLQVYIDHNIES